MNTDSVSVEHVLPDGSVVEGRVTDGYEPVLHTFIDNFVTARDLGAACAVYRDGSLVVDLWGGTADRSTGRAWQRDTRVLTFSCTKGIVALSAAILVDRGLLTLDEPVSSSYWPEFASAGKEAVTVRMLMNHSSGLPVLARPLTREQILAWDPVIEVLQKQRPMWPPGEGWFYHGQTYGWLVGEVIRRVSGMRPAEFVRSEIAAPLEVSTSIGAAAAELHSLARIEPPLPSAEEAQTLLDGAMRDHPYLARMLTLDDALPFPGYGGDETYNTPEVLLGELPAANLVSSAVDLARIYGAAVAEVDGRPPIVSETTIGEMTRWETGGVTGDPVMPPELRWGAGFMIDSPPIRPMLGPGSFGHDGAGGSVAFGHPAQRVGFAYVTNQMGGIPDERANDLCRALATVLDA